jgi:tRNA(adenine34) deaminase
VAYLHWTPHAILGFALMLSTMLLLLILAPNDKGFSTGRRYRTNHGGTVPEGVDRMKIERDDQCWMQIALDLARQAEAEGEVPVGAVVVRDGTILGEGWNRPILTHDPTAHAEIIALRNAATRVNNYRLTGATLYVTLEPCMMCAGAMIHARFKRLVYAANDTKRGACDLFELSSLNHRVEVTSGVCAEECSQYLQQFFRQKRQVQQDKKKPRNERG